MFLVYFGTGARCFLGPPLSLLKLSPLLPWGHSENDGHSLGGTILRHQQEWWQLLAGCHKGSSHQWAAQKFSHEMYSASEEPGYRQMVLIYMHRSFWEKVSSEANWFENRSTSSTFLELGENLEGAWWMAAWGLKEQGLPAPRVYTRLCTLPHVYRVFISHCLSLLLPLETIFLDLLICFLLATFFFILIIILLKNFKLKYSFVFF